MTHLQPVIRLEGIEAGGSGSPSNLRLLTTGFSWMLREHRSKFQLNLVSDLLAGSPGRHIRAQYQVEF